MAAILVPRVVRRIAGECTDVDERGAVGIRLEPAAAVSAALTKPGTRSPAGLWQLGPRPNHAILDRLSNP
jgi:hypothetical protein